ncbi:MAG TPA: DUF5666 domain-containing protein [Anaerolineales bacterium]|nr:DUF5666 domain-containing protein [Anaerolineales bacterium]
MRYRMWTIILSLLSLIALTACAEAARASADGLEGLTGASRSISAPSQALDLFALGEGGSEGRLETDIDEDLSGAVEEGFSVSGSDQESGPELEDGELSGVVQSIGDDMWQVGDKVVQVTPSTKIEAGIGIGSAIEVEYITSPDGSLTAISIELEDEADEQEGETEIGDDDSSDDADEVEHQDEHDDDVDEDQSGSGGGGSHSD